MAVTRSTASRARSGLPILTFGISQLPSQRKRATAGEFHGWRAALVRHPLMPGLISSSLGTDGSLPFISFSTSHPELNSARPLGTRTASGRSAIRKLRDLGVAVEVYRAC